MGQIWSVVLVLALACTAARAQSPAPRVEVPIEDVRLSDGVHRYGVRIVVGGKPVLAGIDTGAAGLRLMPVAAEGAQIKAETTAESYGFGSGARLAGVVGRTKIEIGGLAGETSAHLVQKVDCQAGRPNCPGRLSLGYGFLGDGLPGEGFRVLLGGSMGPSSIDSPLAVVGARRWIIELPTPGELGRLILNPTTEEMAGYRWAALVGGHAERDGGGLHDAVAGCLRSLKDGRRVCGRATLDTGAYLIRLSNLPAGLPRWAEGEALAFDILGADRAPMLSTPITVGEPAQGLSYQTAPMNQTILQMGVAPYDAFSVLYDPAGRRIGFKPRLTARP